MDHGIQHLDCSRLSTVPTTPFVLSKRNGLVLQRCPNLGGHWALLQGVSFVRMLEKRGFSPRSQQGCMDPATKQKTNFCPRCDARELQP